MNSGTTSSSQRTPQAPADVWHAANSGSFVGDGSTAHNWERVASLLRGWPQFVTGPTAKDWFPLLPRLRSVLVSPSSSQGQGHKDDATAAAASAVSHEPAAALLRQVVAAALREGASSLVVTGAGEVYRENVTRLLSSATPACGGVLEVLLALFTQEESEAVVGSAAQTLGAVAEAVSADDQLKRELLVAPSTLLKAVKQLVRKLGQLAVKPDHSSRLADVVEGAMICLRALSGTVRAQCANVEAACIHLLDSPHAAVRKAVAECMSVRPWCSGMDEWSGLVGATISTIHYHINSNYPPAPGVRQGLPAPFQLPGRSYTGGSVALERRLSTLFTTLRHCLGAPPTNQPARAVPVPIPHLLDLIARVVALSPVSAHFDSPNRSKLGLWTILPTLHAHAYRLLSSLTVCVGRHLLPHYAAVRRLFVHGLERSSQEQSVAWTRPLRCLLESIGFAFPVLASCLWKDGATSILSQVLPLLSAQHVAPNATQRALQLSAMKVVGAVVRHAGPVLTDLHAIEIHHTVLTAAAKPVSLAFQEETRRVLADLCLLPQTAPLLPGTLRVLQHDAHAQSIASSSSAASASAVAVSELLIHPRVLPRVRLAPPPLPTPAAVLASVPLTAPTVVPVPVHTPWAVEELNSAKRKTVDDDDRMVITHEQLSQPAATTTTTTILSAVTAPSPKRARTEELAEPLSTTNTTTSSSSSSSSSSTVQQPLAVSVSVSASAVLPAALPEPEPERVTPVVSVFAAPTAATQVTTALPTFSTPAGHGIDEDATEEMADIIADGPDSSDEEGDAEEDVGAEDEDEDEEDEI